MRFYFMVLLVGLIAFPAMASQMNFKDKAECKRRLYIVGNNIGEPYIVGNVLQVPIDMSFFLSSKSDTRVNLARTVMCAHIPGGTGQIAPIDFVDKRTGEVFAHWNGMRLSSQ